MEYSRPRRLLDDRPRRLLALVPLRRRGRTTSLANSWTQSRTWNDVLGQLERNDMALGPFRAFGSIAVLRRCGCASHRPPTSVNECTLRCPAAATPTCVSLVQRASSVEQAVDARSICRRGNHFRTESSVAARAVVISPGNHTADRNNMDHVDSRPDPAERRRPAGLRILGGGIYESVVLDRLARTSRDHSGPARRCLTPEILDSGARRVRVVLVAAVIVTWGIQTSGRRF